MFFVLRHLTVAARYPVCHWSYWPAAAASPAPAPVAGHGHEHADEMPETFSAAVADLQEHAPEIKEAFDAGKPEDADEALHHVAHLLEELPELIDASNLTPEQKAEAKAAAEQLFEVYDELHNRSHVGGEATEVKYDDHAGKIDESLAKLVVLAPAEDAHGEDHAAEGTEAATDRPVEEPQAEAPVVEEPAVEAQP